MTVRPGYHSRVFRGYDRSPVRAEPTGPNDSPLDPAHAATEIEGASDRQQIFDLLLRAARSRTRFAAVLSVHTDHIRGRSALADTYFDCSAVGGLRIPRNTVRAFEQAIASGSPSIGSLATGDLFIDGFLETLGGAPPSTLLLPVSVGTRTIALVAAHRGEDALTLDEIQDLFPLLSASSRALERVLGQRTSVARAAVVASPLRANTDDAYEVEVTVEDVPAKRARLEVNRRAQAWDEVGEGIRELLRDGMEHGDPDEDEQLELLLELGRIEADQLGRPERAIAAWKSAQTIDGGEPRVLDALEGLFVQQGRWLDCIELIEKRVALTDGQRPRIAMLLNLASLAHERLEDDERAIAAYERILTLEPEHEVASRELGKLYTTGKRWRPLAELLLDRASRQGDVKALELVARIYQDRIDDPAAAFLVWLAVFRRDPERPQLVEQLAQVAEAANAWNDIIPETRGLAEELEAKHPGVAAAVWQLVGTWLRDRVGNRTEAIDALDRAARLNPSETGTVAQAAELLRSEQRWTELADLLTRSAEREGDPKRRGELHVELGDLYAGELHQPGEAIVSYERASSADPSSVTALVALHRLYLEAEAWEVLGDLVPRLIEVMAADSPRAVLVDLHVELGSILADHLGRPDDAIEAFRDALALDPKHGPAFRGLAAIYQATGQVEALLETSEAELDATSPPDQQQRYVDLAAAWHEYARLDRAAACWQKVLALDPRNAVAHRGLARALEEDEQWASLAVAQRAHLKLVVEPFERVALLLEHALLLGTQFDNVDASISAYQEVLRLDPDNRTALDALGGLYDRTGQWQAALDMLKRLVAASTNPRERGDLLQRIGHVQLSSRDAAGAEASFAEAITLAPDHAKAHEGLARVLLQQGKLAPAGERLLRAADLAATKAETVRLLADAAWVYRHRLDDSEQARECLQRILALDPDHADAKQAIAELLHDTEQWESLWPHLEEQAERAKTDATMPPADRLAIVSKAARCALELGRPRAALELYDVACSIDPGPGSLLERAEALYRSKSLDAAATAFQAIATQHATSLERAQLFGVYRRLAGIHAELGNIKQALTFHGKVLDIDRTHRGTLEEVTELHLARGNFDEAIASLKLLAEAADPAERVSYLERIGDLYRDRQANPARAMSTYLEALELDKANRRILQRVLDLQSETGQWKAAVETIDRFIAIEADRARRGAYLVASAEIRRTHLKDLPGALECYETAIDEMFREEPLRAATRERALDAFHALRELVVADADWKYLEQSYRRMIKRLAPDDPILVPLWDALGDVYRTRLDHPQSAIEALEVAHAIDPDKSAQRARVLAELYTQTGAKRPEQVTGRAAKLIEVDPMNADAYRALGRTSLEAGRVDEAWCVARALVVLKQANSDEKALYRKYQALETRKAKGTLDEDAWAFVRHPDEDLTISAIFALTWQAAVSLRAGPTKAFNLKAKERLDIEEATGVVAKIFKHASRVVNVALPDVYVQPRRPGRLLLANCIEKGKLAPAVIVGRDLMTGYRDTEIAASVGTMLALLRPSYYLKLTLATVEELEVALAAAAQVVGRKRASRPEHADVIATLASALQRMLTRPMAEAVLSLVDRLPEQVDLARWRNAVDAAAQRAGLLIAGDLAAATRMIAVDATPLGGQRPSQRVQELIAYSVSPAYFAARQHLGVSVE